MLEGRPAICQVPEEGWQESDCPVLLHSHEFSSPVHLCAECEVWSQIVVEESRGYRMITWSFVMGSVGLLSQVPAVTAVAHYFTDLI